MINIKLHSCKRDIEDGGHAKKQIVSSPHSQDIPGLSTSSGQSQLTNDDLVDALVTMDRS